MRDTSPQARKRYYELLKRQSPSERLETAMRLNRTVRELAETAIRAQHPNATPERVRAELAARLYGRAVAERLFPNELGS